MIRKISLGSMAVINGCVSSGDWLQTPDGKSIHNVGKEQALRGISNAGDFYMLPPITSILRLVRVGIVTNITSHLLGITVGPAAGRSRRTAFPAQIPGIRLRRAGIQLRITVIRGEKPKPD